MIPHPIRISDNAVIGPAQVDLVIRALNARIAAARGTAPLTVLHYGPGQQYRPHHDTIAGVANRRGWTTLVYLNDGFAVARPRSPPAALVCAVRAATDFCSATPIPRAFLILVPSMPVAGIAGHKWLCTRWIRLAPQDLGPLFPSRR
jgi:prolyl 4-hydroxylase